MKKLSKIALGLFVLGCVLSNQAYAQKGGNEPIKQGPILPNSIFSQIPTTACLGEFIGLEVPLNNSSVTYEWTGPLPSSTVVSTNFNYLPTVSGTYRFRIFINNAIFTRNITVFQRPEVTIDGPNLICVGQEVTLDGEIDFNNPTPESTTQAGNGGVIISHPNSFFEWTFLDESGNLTTLSNQSTDITVCNPGTYTLTATNSRGCVGSASFVLSSEYGLEWSRRWGGPESGQPLYTFFDEVNSSVYITGATNSGTDIGTGPVNSAFNIPIPANRHAYVTRFDEEGEAVWTTIFPSGGGGIACRVKTAPNGDVYVVGNGGLDAYDTPGIIPNPENYHNLSLGAGTRGFVAKLNPTNGSVIWMSFLKFGSGEGLAIDVNNLGENIIYVAGTCTASVIPDGNGAEDNTFFDGGIDAYIARYDDFGDQQWLSYYSKGPASTGWGIDYSVDGANIYLTGVTGAGGPVFGIPNAAGSNYGGGNEAYVASYDVITGNLVGHAYSGNPENDDALDLRVNSRGEIFTVGTTRTPGEEAIGLNSYSSTLAHQYEIGYGGTDATGHNYAGPLNFETSFEIHIDSRDNLYIGGFSGTTLNFDSGFAPYRDTKSPTRADGVLFRLKDEGSNTPPSINWWTYFGAPAAEPNTSAITRGGVAVQEQADGTVNIYTSGQGEALVTPDFFGANPGTQFVAKFSCTPFFGCEPGTIVNQLANGDFEDEFALINSGLSEECRCDAGSYCVGSQATEKCSLAVEWINGTWDHTFGDPTGNYLIVDGALTTIWSDFVNVVDGELYHFSFWNLREVSDDPTNNSTQTFNILIDSILVGTFTTDNALADEWTQYSLLWTATFSNPNAELEIVQIAATGFNDYGIDDIVFGTCDEANVFRQNSSENVATSQNDNDIKVYPNPTQNNLTIEWDEARTVTVIEIFSLDGKAMMQIPVTDEHQVNIQVAEFKDGVYLIKIDNETKRFVVSH